MKLVRRTIIEIEDVEVDGLLYTRWTGRDGVARWYRVVEPGPVMLEVEDADELETEWDELRNG